MYCPYRQLNIAPAHRSTQNRLPTWPDTRKELALCLGLRPPVWGGRNRLFFRDSHHPHMKFSSIGFLESGTIPREIVAFGKRKTDVEGHHKCACLQLVFDHRNLGQNEAV